MMFLPYSILIVIHGNIATLVDGVSYSVTTIIQQSDSEDCRSPLLGPGCMLYTSAGT